MTEHIFFDLDGTLVDSRPGIVGSLKHAVKTVLPDVNIENLQFRIGPPIREIMTTAIGEINDSVLMLLESEFRKNYDVHGWKLAVLYPGVHDTLQELARQGRKMYIVTNKPTLPTMQMLPHLNAENYFEHILSRDSQSPPFPNKVEMIKFLIEKYHISPDTVVFVGDSEEDGIAAGECQMRFIGIEYGYGVLPHIDGMAAGVKSFPDLLGLV